MNDFSEDTLVHCYTISPKMMEKLIEIYEEKELTETNRQHIGYLLSKLKSARFIIGGYRGETYYKHAEELIAKNRKRFSLLAETSHTPDRERLLYVRKRKEVILELVLLSLDIRNDVFNAVNFTGEMDREFIQLLSENEKPQQE